MTSVPARMVDARRFFEQAANCLVLAIAISLPWSTSATGIFIVLWLVAVIPTLKREAVRDVLLTPAGGLPVLLWALAAAGMLWADASWSERLGGLNGFHRLLLIPLVLTQFRQTGRASRVFGAFLASVCVVLMLSWATKYIPGFPWRARDPGIPAKDYILQSEEFLLCAVAVLAIAFDQARMGRWLLLVAGAVALAALFLANISFVVTGRTTLLMAPALILLLGWRQYRWKGVVGAALVGALVSAGIWASSPNLRQRMKASVQELEAYQANNAPNSTGLHLTFLKESLAFVAGAPIVGHGTGSIPQEFRKASAGQTGAASVASVNPHNQILAVAIQLGLLGALALIAMWIAHVALLWSDEIVVWSGLIMVVGNIVACLFNTHLFDFSQGWLYVFGIGVAGGTALRRRDMRGLPGAASS